jgi:hypothetical protein
MSSKLVIGFLACAAAGSAAAKEPAAISANMFFNGKLWSGVIAQGDDDGWTLPLPPAAQGGSCVVQFRDLTQGPLPRADRSERIDAGRTQVIALTRGRYTANHMYGMSVRCGDFRSHESLVQLLPSEDELRSWMGGPAPTLAKR